MHESPLDRFAEEMDRKEAHLAKLRDHSSGEKSANNYIVAENETLWEIGHFSDKKPDKEDLESGLLVRMRRDTYATRLNSGDALTELAGIEAEIHSLQRSLRDIRYVVILMAVISIYMMFR